MAKRPIIALVCLSGHVAGDIAVHLERRGYEVRVASEEWEAGPLFDAVDADVVVLGDGLASQASLDWVRRLEGPSLILVRPAADLTEKVLALELGAADVVDTPVNVRELAARIGGLLQRRGRPGSQLVMLENATVDLKSALVMHRTGAEELLSPGQVALLKLFFNNPRKVLTRDDIMAAAPAENLDAFDRSIDSRIVRLRRKIDTESIVTIRGAGYRFDPPGQRQE